MSGSAVRIEEGAVVCDGAVLEGGDITIGPGTVVFPGALIRCSEGAGPVVIGRGCVLEESSIVECVDAGGLLVGEGNLFEVGCTVRALAVGDYNVFQPKCVVDRSVKVASGCSIGPKVSLRVSTTLPSNVSLFRLDDYPDEYRMKSRPKNTEYNRARVNAYRTALASQGKKYYLGKYNKLLPATTEGA
ncbi:unnamed protein product [Ascophyllum nodosum]